MESRTLEEIFGDNLTEYEGTADITVHGEEDGTDIKTEVSIEGRGDVALYCMFALLDKMGQKVGKRKLAEWTIAFLSTMAGSDEDNSEWDDYSFEDDDMDKGMLS